MRTRSSHILRLLTKSACPRNFRFPPISLLPRATRSISMSRPLRNNWQSLTSGLKSKNPLFKWEDLQKLSEICQGLSIVLNDKHKEFFNKHPAQSVIILKIFNTLLNHSEGNQINFDKLMDFAATDSGSFLNLIGLSNTIDLLAKNNILQGNLTALFEHSKSIYGINKALSHLLPSSLITQANFDALINRVVNIENINTALNQIAVSKFGLSQATYDKIIKLVDLGFKAADVVFEVAKLKKGGIFSGINPHADTHNPKLPAAVLGKKM